MRLQAVDPKEFAPSLLPAFGRENALLAAGDKSGCNAMTIGWCQAGRLWSLPVCTVYVRPERYTYQFMEKSAVFTVSVLPESAREAMAVFGTKSGRDLDKIKACGLTVRYGAGDAPFFEEAEKVLVCRTLFVQDMAPECVRDDRILAHYGAKGGWHRIYTGEVLEAYSV
ncbi:MAG: flavin reductase [Oscillibacter sp.]|nr:flavin reductase [Oscillibacter sp.]